jgi:hypothetical protein
VRIAVPLFSAVVCAAVCSHAIAVEIPKGWRFPSKTELTADEERNDSPTHYARAVADLNGDGVEDEAFLLKSTRFSGEALWVRLSNGSDGFTWRKLQEIRWGKDHPLVDLSMAIEIVKPGVIPYSCFDDAKECNFGDDAGRPKLKLKDPALMYFRLGSAASMYFWSSKHKRFLKVWLSD